MVQRVIPLERCQLWFVKILSLLSIFHSGPVYMTASIAVLNFWRHTQADSANIDIPYNNSAVVTNIHLRGCYSA